MNCTENEFHQEESIELSPDKNRQKAFRVKSNKDSRKKGNCHFLPSSSGIRQYEGVITSIAEEDSVVLWSVNLGMSDKVKAFKPIVHNGFIFINAGGFTSKYDVNGKPILSVETGALNYIKPAVDDNHNIYVVCKRELICLDFDGNEKWRQSIGSVSHTPLIDEDGFLYLARKDGYVVSLNPTGKEMWKKKIKELESKKPFIDTKSFLHVHQSEGSHVVMKRKPGLLNHQVVCEVSGMSLKPVVAGPEGRLYYAIENHDGSYYTCMDPDKTIKWKSFLGKDVKSVFTRVFGENRILVVVRTDSILSDSDEDDSGQSHRVKKSFIVAFDYDGNELFRFEADGQEKFSRHIAIADDGTIYLTGEDKQGKLYAIDKDGNLLWKQLDKDPISRPILGLDGIILTGGKKNPIKAFSTRDGSFLWKKDMELADGQSYQVTGDGAIIAVDRMGKMIKLKI
ncbi:MAG: PQQ-binding-like beta-propeller repeat protein [Candidatus Eremiobacteraeota bacterium]|nr:PQQ-binding-like beta-propeller repeat protein [Candidatus Eremiobacteraeota bacterium]